MMGTPQYHQPQYQKQPGFKQKLKTSFKNVRQGVNKDAPLLGTLFVRVIEARNLQPLPHKEQLEPFLKARCGSQSYLGHVAVGESCSWNEELRFSIFKSNEKVTLKVRDRNMDKKWKNHLGVCGINVKHTLDGVMHDWWIHLDSAASGEVHVQVQFVPANSRGPSMMSMPAPSSQPTHVLDERQRLNYSLPGHSSVNLPHPNLSVLGTVPSTTSQTPHPQSNVSRAVTHPLRVGTQESAYNNPAPQQRQLESSFSSTMSDPHRTTQQYTSMIASSTHSQSQPQYESYQQPQHSSSQRVPTHEQQTSGNPVYIEASSFLNDVNKFR